MLSNRVPVEPAVRDPVPEVLLGQGLPAGPRLEDVEAYGQLLHPELLSGRVDLVQGDQQDHRTLLLPHHTHLVLAVLEEGGVVWTTPGCGRSPGAGVTPTCPGCIRYISSRTRCIRHIPTRTHRETVVRYLDLVKEFQNRSQIDRIWIRTSRKKSIPEFKDS